MSVRIRPAAGRRIAGFAAAALLVLPLAACGAEDPAPSAQLSAEDAMIKYAQCMRDHGVDMPDPKPGGGVSIAGGSLTEEEMQAAEQDCGDLRRQAMPADGGQQLTEEEKQRILNMVTCMRDRGHDMPDPNFGGGMVTQQDSSGGNGPDPEDPAFSADMAECAQQAGVEGGSNNTVNE